MVEYKIRVKFDELKKKCCVIRLVFEEGRLVKKQCLNSIGEWIDIAEGAHYLWDESIEFYALVSDLAGIDSANWILKSKEDA